GHAPPPSSRMADIAAISSAPRIHLPGGWLAASMVIAALVVMPVCALIAIALHGSGDVWPHLAKYVLPVALRDTAMLLVGVGVVAALLGVGSAWLVTAYDFPGRRVFDWALLLPLAIPTYIM